MKITILEKAENQFKIIFYDNDSDVVFITFHGITGTLNSEPFGQSYLSKKGFSVIACFQEAGSSYQFLSFDRFKKAVTPVLENKKIFLYGSSLGGYCALYYSGAVNGTVIAASPRISEHPILQELNNKKSDDGLFKHAQFKDLPKTNKKIHIFHDSTNKVDAVFLNEIIKKQISSELLEVHNCDYVGHPNIIRHLRAAGEMDRVLDSIINDDGVVNEVMSEIKNTDFVYFGKALNYYEKAKLNIKKVKDPTILADSTKIKLFKEIESQLTGENFSENETDFLIKKNKALLAELKRIKRFKSRLTYRLAVVIVKNSKTFRGWLNMPLALYRELTAFKKTSKNNNYQGLNK